MQNNNFKMKIKLYIKIHTRKDIHSNFRKIVWVLTNLFLSISDSLCRRDRLNKTSRKGQVVKKEN